MAAEEFSPRTAEAGELEAQASAFSDLGRSLTEALEQARLQAGEIIERAQEQSTAQLKSTDRRLAEALRQATAAERRAAAAQSRLAGLEGRIERVQAELVQIGAHAHEIARLITATELAPAIEQVEAPKAPDLDPLAALALLRGTVDAFSSADRSPTDRDAWSP